MQHLPCRFILLWHGHDSLCHWPLLPGWGKHLHRLPRRLRVPNHHNAPASVFSRVLCRLDAVDDLHDLHGRQFLLGPHRGPCVIALPRWHLLFPRPSCLHAVPRGVPVPQHGCHRHSALTMSERQVLGCWCRNLHCNLPRLCSRPARRTCSELWRW